MKGLRSKSQILFISFRVAKDPKSSCTQPETPKLKQVCCIEVLDLECVLCHVTGVQNEKKNPLINPPSWIFPRSVVYKMSWGEFNLPL